MLHAACVALSPDEIHRVIRTNREEYIEAEYVPRLSDSGIWWPNMECTFAALDDLRLAQG